MLAKCANATCSTPFRRMSEGKLFMVESNGRQEDENDSTRKKAPHRIEYFWLCDSCAAMLTLIFDSRNGISTVPLPQSERELGIAKEISEKRVTAQSPFERRVHAAGAR